MRGGGLRYRSLPTLFGSSHPAWTAGSVPLRAEMPGPDRRRLPAPRSRPGRGGAVETNILAYLRCPLGGSECARSAILLLRSQAEQASPARLPVTSSFSRPHRRAPDWRRRSSHYSTGVRARRSSRQDVAIVAIPALPCRRSRVTANGRPLGRTGDLAVVRERFAEHPSGLFAGRPRYGGYYA